MSFSNEDPKNQPELRVSGDRFWWECGSCAADGFRVEIKNDPSFQGWPVTGPFAPALTSWRAHLKVSHPHVLSWGVPS